MQVVSGPLGHERVHFTAPDAERLESVFLLHVIGNFETAQSFQYPTFHQHDGAIYLTVTQGDSDPSRKERIMFGKLE